MKRFLLILPLLALGGCRVHQKLDPGPPLCPPPSYSALSSSHYDGDGWWRDFGASDLDQTVEEAFAYNFEVREALWKVVEACAEVRVQAAGLWPEVSISGEVSRSKSGGFGGGVGVGSGLGAGTQIDTRRIEGILSYEIDLWKRVDSLARSAQKEAQASCEDLQAVKLNLAGTVVDNWLEIQEKKRLLEVIEHQIEVSQTLLKLVELRFSLGQSSALDVYQQRLQLAATESERPTIQSELEVGEHQQSVLIGRFPEKGEKKTPRKVTLPSLEGIGTPKDLLMQRPDLRSIYRRIEAADYQVAAAIAERFPRFDFDLSYGFQSLVVGRVFEGEIYRIAGRMLYPLFDAGKRKAQVDKNQAALFGLIESYGQAFITAVKEVEDALSREKGQKELVEQIGKEIEIANKNLTEARIRYINGLVDYLTVIAAIQSLQDLERRLVTEEKTLFQNRSQLYRALGKL